MQSLRALPVNFLLLQVYIIICAQHTTHSTWLDPPHNERKVSWPQRKPRLDPPDALLIPIPIAALCECITETIAAGHSNFEVTVYRVGWWSGFGSVHTVRLKRSPPPQIYGPYVMNSNFFWLWTFSCNAIHRYRLIQDHETTSVQDNKNCLKYNENAWYVLHGHPYRTASLNSRKWQEKELMATTAASVSNRTYACVCQSDSVRGAVSGEKLMRIWIDTAQIGLARTDCTLHLPTPIGKCWQNNFPKKAYFRSKPRISTRVKANRVRKMCLLLSLIALVA